MIARAAAAAVLLFAGGCTALPTAQAPLDWPARRAALQALERWALDGRIAVAADDEGFSGGFDWSQQGGVADIELRGPLGGTAMSIRVQGDDTVVSVSGETYAGDDARDLIGRHFGSGRSLPVAEMRYWLVGAPAPGAPHEEALGEDQRLARLTQSGWQVRYDRYRSVGLLALPARMELTTEGLRLRIAVQEWRLLP